MRDYPDLVTLEPADDAAVFGDAWPLIVEWRVLMDSHPTQGKGLAWLADEERLRVVELALLEDHGLTLPPEKQPLRDFDRSGQITWRRTALSASRREPKKGRAHAQGVARSDPGVVVEMTDWERQGTWPVR